MVYHGIMPWFTSLNADVAPSHPGQVRSSKHVRCRRDGRRRSRRPTSARCTNNSSQKNTARYPGTEDRYDGYDGYLWIYWWMIWQYGGKTIPIITIHISYSSIYHIHPYIDNIAIWINFCVPSGNAQHRPAGRGREAIAPKVKTYGDYDFSQLRKAYSSYASQGDVGMRTVWTLPFSA